MAGGAGGGEGGRGGGRRGGGGGDPSEFFAQLDKDGDGKLTVEEMPEFMNGHRQDFRVAGIVLSPEYIFESRPGAALPDSRVYPQ